MALQNPITSSSCLDLTISMPGFASSTPSDLPSSGEKEFNCVMRDLDINQVPKDQEEQWLNLYGGGSIEDEEESSNGGPHTRKKLRLSKEQARLLEDNFRLNHTLNSAQKEALAMELKLRPRQVEVWFQNRRARSKLKQTEIECEYLKRWFGSLTEQNRRLQREVEELRAINNAPNHTVFSPHNCESANSSFTMCPGCERVTTITTAATLSAKAPTLYHP